MKIKFTAKGTTCNGCAEIIKEQAVKAGASDVEYDLATETGSLEFDHRKTSAKRIFASIEAKGYQCSGIDGANEGSGGKQGGYGWIFIAIGILIAGYFIYSLAEGLSLPSLTPGLSYGLLFLVGLLTGFHCIAMCGGFVISYTAKDASVGRKSHLSHIYYGAGKTLSYTVIGAAFGLIGSIIAFTPMMRGIAGILAGVFLLLFGLRMLNVFPWLRKFAIRTPSFISRRLGGSKSPLITGLLNGLMIACGPLQAIYIMAAGTGSWFEGAKLLFIFALGTLPVMLGFAYFASFVTSRVTHTILRASGALVIIMGLIMINNGLALTGTGYDVNSLVVSADSPKVLPASADNGVQEIHMDVLASGWSPDKFVLEKGVPVKWIINGKEITSCNNAIVVPKLGLEFDVKPGIQVIEFTPTETGTIPFSCWMGMIHGQFIVVDNAKDDATVKAAFELAAEQAPAKSSGCGCGMHK